MQLQNNLRKKYYSLKVNVMLMIYIRISIAFYFYNTYPLSVIL